MRTVTWCGAIALGLLGSVQVLAETSPTQEKSLDQAQQQSPPAQAGEPAQHSGPPGSTPPPPLTQPQAPIADQAAPAAVGQAQANTTDGAAATPLGATGQTMPSTISKENAALDKLPTTALQFPLTNEQKQLIVKSVAAAPKSPANADLANVHVAMFLPIGIAIQTFSGDVMQQVPDAARYKYVKLDDRVLIVDPPLSTVVGEIKLQAETVGGKL